MPASRSDIAAAMRRLRCRPAEAIALVILAAGAVAAVGLLWLLAAGAPLPGASVPSGVTATPAVPGDAATDGPLEVSAGEVVVHVTGSVREPGVYTLPGGARVGEAVAAAGGPRRTAVLDGLNLARVLTDGEQIVVPRRGEDTAAAPGGGAPQPGGTAPATPRVSLNQATVADLETLPNIGPVLATRIVEYRDSIGGFTDVGQLRDVPGIGEKTFQSMVDLVTL